MKHTPFTSAAFWLGACLAGSARAELAIRVEEAAQRYTVEEAGKPVLTYNFGPVPVPAGVSGKYAVARGDYVHPLYGPDGQVLTTDYSPDHPHHRGLYWAWPEVTYKGETRDLHALQGVFARPVRIVRQEASAQAAVLEAENVWKWGDQEEIVREHATLTVRAAQGGLRALDFSFRFEALQPGVTLARRSKNQYGGFNLRFSPRERQTIEKHTGSAAAYPHVAWAALTGVPPGGQGPVGVLLFQKPTNPGYPGDWQDYPNLNWLQPTFPAAGAAYALVPGKPLVLEYRVLVRSGEGLKADPAALFAAYAEGCPDPLAALAGYKIGDSREALAVFEEGLRVCTPAERAAAERRLLKLLAAQPSPDLTRWACRQLQLVGGPASVPALAPLLTGEAWQEACDALLALPGPEGADALLAALPALVPPRRATVLHALGLKRHTAAVPALARAAASQDAAVREAALTALGRIATPEAADALLGRQTAGAAAASEFEARLLCAQGLAGSSRDDPAAKAPLHGLAHLARAAALLASVRDDPAATAPQRAAAFLGLARLAPAENVDAVLTALAGTDAHLRRAAAAALQEYDVAALARLRPRFASLPREARLAVLAAWGGRGVAAAEPELLGCLAGGDEAERLAAVRALCTAGGAAAVPPLLTLAGADTGDFGREAEAALRQLPGAGVSGALQQEARSGEPKRAARALVRLAERKDAGHLAFLLGLVKEGDTRQREDALDALKRFADGDTLTALGQALAERPEQEEALAQTMLAICQRQAVPPEVQRVALRAACAGARGERARALLRERLAELDTVSLARGKKVTSSHPWQGDLRPERAVDGNPETYWSCAFSPSWLQVDLGAVQSVSRVGVVNFVDGARYYQFKVEVSPDGAAWTCVGDLSANTAPATKEGVTFSFQAVAARYVRVTMLKNSANPGMHISELSVFGGGAP